MYHIQKVKIWNVSKLQNVVQILYKCGKNMASTYDLHHWDNSRIKNWLIVILCALKNKIYLVYDDKTAVATFQTRKINEAYLFQKLATLKDQEFRIFLKRFSCRINKCRNVILFLKKRLFFYLFTG